MTIHILEAAVVEKPIYFYTYDYDKYMDDRGWYIDYKKEMPGPILTEFKDIINLISYIFHCIGDPEVSQALEQPIQWLKDTIKDLSSFFFFDISKSSFRLVSVTVIQWGQQIQIYNTEKEKVLLTSFFF